jgi:hypothetical protein
MGQKQEPVVFRQVAPRIFILIEGEEFAVRSEPFEDTPGMSAAAIGAVNVSSFRLNPEAVENFFQQDGKVIGLLIPM